MKFLAASVYCACVALVALGLTLLAIAHATSIVSASVLIFVGAFCVASTVILSRALTGRGETQRPALDLGTEGEGLPDSLLASLHTVRITRSEGFDSLNGAAASAIALHHFSAQET